MFTKIHPVGVDFFPSGYTDGQTNMLNLVAVFRNSLAKVPKKKWRFKDTKQE